MTLDSLMSSLPFPIPALRSRLQDDSFSESPLHRAGLLQPMTPASSFPARQPVTPHSQRSIRLNTVHLSNLHTPLSLDDTDLPPTVDDTQDRASSSLFPPNTFPETCSQPFRPSGLSLLLASRRDIYQEQDTLSVPFPLQPGPVDPPTETSILHHDHRLDQETLFIAPNITLLSPPSHAHSSSPSLTETDTAPLLSTHPAPSYATCNQQSLSSEPITKLPCAKSPARAFASSAINSLAEAVQPKSVKSVLVLSLKALPAVVLGSLLNILDGVSYGMILFPSVGVFTGLGPMGVSMFFVSTLIAQLVYTLGGSGFAGANGSMLIEIVPFFHILALSISQEIGEDKPREVIVTTLFAYVLSSLLTGLTFFLLGALKLGVIIGFFPRHILVGCIGGIGVFLIQTGLKVSLRIDDDELTMTWSTFKFIFLNMHSLPLWTIPLGLAIFLRVITHRYHHQLIFPLYFIVIPAVFYVVFLAGRMNFAQLRADGWVFDMGPEGHEPWYKFYSYLDFHAVRFWPLWSTLPTQFALLFFNILHPPLNVPALAVSLNEDVDTDKELVAHGYSNFLAAICGTVPNYLVYVNTVLFYRVGGGTRLAGFWLAMATGLLLYIGTGPIAYLPVMVVGALIFVLGIDLVKEALWDTRHRVSRLEYITIACIMAAMTWWDFVIGVLFGICVSCFFFVVQNSQSQSIRAFHTGETAMSTVRRPGIQRSYIREVSKQTSILRLQGFLFFGTIASVERTIREAIEGPGWQRNPVRFLVVDLSLVAGVDMSSAEAFVRVQRMLAPKYITLVFCGIEADSAVGRSLRSVGVLGGERVELFSTFNDAMEWTENAYLRAWFRSQKAETSPMVALPGRQDADIAFQRSLASSPRRSHLDDAGNRTIAHSTIPHPPDEEEPYNTLIKTLSSYGQLDGDQFRRLSPYFTRLAVPEGLVLFRQNDPSDGLYIVESGILRAVYQFSEHTPSIEESMVPGTLAGELTGLSSMPRNATVTVERAAVLWKLGIGSLKKLEEDDPVLATAFTRVLLKEAKIDYDILLSALATRQ